MPFKLHDYRRAAAITFLSLPLGLRAESQYQAMPQLSVKPNLSPLPSLSIIIPARNEAINLTKLLPSLKLCNYPGLLEIIVVDDNSNDQTANIARSYGVKVICLKTLVEGCLGKPYASHQGAKAAQGDWLLFTDADTIHTPHGPASAVAYSIEHKLEGLSLFIKQECRGDLDRLALMTAFAGLFAGKDPTEATLNGQYILLKRDAYWNSGGFEIVCDQPMEDLAMGENLRRRGYYIPTMRGENAASVYMYDDARHVWHGMTRLGSGTMKWSGTWSILTALFITALMSPLIVLTGVLSGKLRSWLLPITWMAVSISMIPWAKRYGSWKYALLAPIGGLIVQIAALAGIINRISGHKYIWKDRRV